MPWQDAPIVSQPKWASAPVVRQETAQPTQPPADNRPVGDLGTAIMEPLATLGSSAIAMPIAGLAGLGTAGARALGLTSAQPADVVERVQGALTFQPRTQAGQIGTEIISFPFEKLAQLADVAGQRVLDTTGSPVLATAVNTAVQSAPAVFGKALPRRGNVRPAPVDRPVVAGEAPQNPAAPAPAQRAAGLEGVRPEPARTVDATQVEYVAPDLKLEQTTRPRQQPPQSQAEVRAREYVRESGLDWNALPAQIQETLVRVAEDARNFSRLDRDALARELQLQSLPVPVPATRGILTRDPVQLRNEGNVAATTAGQPIRQIHLDANQALLENLEVLKGKVRGRGQTAGTATTPEAVGLSVQDEALRAKAKLSLERVREKYREAEAAGELQAKVSPVPILKTIAASPDKTHFGWVRSWFDEMGIVQKTKSGTVTNKVSLKELEDLRQAAVARAANGGTDAYYAGKIIRAIDEVTEGAGGAKYKEARAARRAHALEFEDQAAVARLVDNKSRTDRAVALEDTWRKTVLGGSIEDLRRVKRSLLTGGDAKTRTAGRRAWRDIKAQTIEYIRREATKSVALNDRGQPNVTPAAMKRAVDSIGPQKLDEIFGPGTARQINRIVEATRIVKTEPPPIHKGSSTMGNVLAFLERGLGRLPGVGDFTVGTIKGVVRLKELGQESRVVREAQQTPLRNAMSEAQRRNAMRDF
ncbi:MAG TPA: hypothetical protein VF193_07505 [Steroidobacter sp.]